MKRGLYNITPFLCCSCTEFTINRAEVFAPRFVKLNFIFHFGISMSRTHPLIRYGGRSGGLALGVAGARQLGKMMGSYVKSRPRQSQPTSSSTSSGVTTIQNRKVSYRKRRRRISPRRRRRTKKFRRSVNRVIDSRLAKNGYTFSAVPGTVAIAGGTFATQWASLSLYGASQATVDKDLITMFQDQHQAEHGATGVPQGDKLTILSAALESVFSNVSGTPLIIEVYQIVPKIDNSGAGGSTALSGQFAAFFADTPASGGVGTTQPAATDALVTPFDNKAFCTRWTVVKSTKYYLNTGDSATFAFRQKKVKYINYAQASAEYYCRKYFTGFLFRVTPVSTAPSASTNWLTWQWKKSYQITRLEENEPTANKM